MSSSRDEDRQQALSHHPQQDLVPPASGPSPPGDADAEDDVRSSQTEDAVPTRYRSAHSPPATFHSRQADPCHKSKQHSALGQYLCDEPAWTLTDSDSTELQLTQSCGGAAALRGNKSLPDRAKSPAVPRSAK